MITPLIEAHIKKHVEDAMSCLVEGKLIEAEISIKSIARMALARAFGCKILEEVMAITQLIKEEKVKRATLKF